MACLLKGGRWTSRYRVYASPRKALSDKGPVLLSGSWCRMENILSIVRCIPFDGSIAEGSAWKQVRFQLQNNGVSKTGLLLWINIRNQS